MSRDSCVALPLGPMGLSAVCICSISWYTNLLFLNIYIIHDQVLPSIEKELDAPKLKVEQTIKYHT